MPRGSSRTPSCPGAFVIILSILLLLGSNSLAAVLSVCTNGCGFASIADAIAAARAGDTISIARGTYFEGLVIRKKLTLSGSGISQTIIDGSRSNRVVTIASNVSVVMRNLSIQNGMVTGAPGQSVFGGGIFNEGFLTLRNVAVVSNTISGGHSVSRGVGGHAQGAGVFSRGRLSLKSCSVIGNHAGAGGADYSGNIGGTGGNASGAGVYSDGRLDAVRCVFSNNTATGALGIGGVGGCAFGGAIFSTRGPVRVQDCRLAGNVLAGGYAYLYMEHGHGRGGGIYNEAPAELVNCVIDANCAGGSITFGFDQDSQGGGVFNAGTLSIVRCAITANIADQGGGLHNTQQMFVANCQLYGNVSAQGGGLFNNGVLVMQECLFRTNRVQSLGTSAVYGGGLYNACTARMAACWFENNASIGEMAGENIGGSAYGAGVFNEGDISLLNSTLNGNSARGRSAFATAGDAFGGALFNTTSGGMVLENSILSGNCAVGGSAINAGAGCGGGIYNQGVASLNHCTIVTNMALQGAGYSGPPYSSPGGDGSGGGVYTETPVQIANAILAGNFASMGGFDCNGILESEGYNLIGSTSSCTVQGVVAGNIFGVNPLLGPLRACGGFAPTHPLLPGSPAIDAGTAGGLVTDQRGAPRVTDIPNVPNAGDGSDIGAYETKRRDVVITKSASPEMPVPGQPITYTIEVANVGLSPMTSVTVLDLLPRDVSFASSVPRPWNGRAFGGIAAYHIGDLGVASQRVIRIQASVRRTATGVIENTAWVRTSPRDDFSLNNLITLESALSPP